MLVWCRNSHALFLNDEELSPFCNRHNFQYNSYNIDIALKQARWWFIILQILYIFIVDICILKSHIVQFNVENTQLAIISHISHCKFWWDWNTTYLHLTIIMIPHHLYSRSSPVLWIMLCIVDHHLYCGSWFVS